MERDRGISKLQTGKQETIPPVQDLKEKIQKDTRERTIVNFGIQLDAIRRLR